VDRKGEVINITLGREREVHGESITMREVEGTTSVDEDSVEACTLKEGTGRDGADGVFWCIKTWVEGQ